MIGFNNLIVRKEFLSRLLIKSYKKGILKYVQKLVV